MDNFDDIIAGLGDITPAQVFEYETIALDGFPEGEQKNRQWALIAPDGTVAAIGPASGGGKSAMIAYAAANPGFRVANRRVTYAAWNVPTE
jgi:hypothetical protein